MMLKLIFYEIKKILGYKAIPVIIGILFVLNIASAYYTENKLSQNSIYNKIIESYIESPEKYTQYYEELKLLDEKRTEEIIKAAKDGRYVDFKLPYTFDSSCSEDDLEILEKVFAQLSYIDKYSEIPIKISDQAQVNLSDLLSYSIPTDTYPVRMQLKLIEKYGHLTKAVKIEPEYPSGYNSYLSNKTVNVYIVLAIITVIPFIFSHEYSCRIYDIIGITKHGRFATSVAKLCVIILLSVIIEFIFSLSTFIVVGLSEGYSSIGNAVQVFKEYSKVPYAITVGEYVILIQMLRMLAFMVIAVFTFLISACFKNYIVSFGSGLIFYGLNLFFDIKSYIGTPPAIRYMNLVCLSNGVDITQVFRTTNIFGFAVSYVELSSFLYITIFIVIAILCIFCRFGFCGIRNKVYLTVLQKHHTNISGLFVNFSNYYKKKKRKFYIIPRTLSCFELTKIMTFSRSAIIILLLASKLIFSIYSYAKPVSYSEILYHQYMTQLSNFENSQERSLFITTERDRLNGIIQQYDNYKIDYMTGKIDSQIYLTYMEEYYDAQVDDTVFKCVESRYQYLIEKEADGYNVSYIYDTGWEKFFDRYTDLFLYTAILIICMSSFSIEFKSSTSSYSFSQILRCTKYGRRQTFYQKLFVVSILCGFIAILFCLIDILTINYSYELPSQQALLMSLSMFRNVNSPITIKQYLLTYFILHAAVSVLLGLFVSAISEILRKPLPILSVTILVTLIPWLMTKIGVHIPVYLDFISIFCINPILLYSALIKILNNDYSILFILYISLASIVYMLLVTARKQYCK